ncbi:hypothetical protein BpHYR1_036159 [Brachionus plicatilis]|uniref:Uncharacterized protein n=1 Tax=Brachionus plicatilis TaxID=10195 RepID=A0A3M7ST98_BRAPC|nr:hypothetical protein BpHYR1_036159 [Brachionus plicatilis]
MSQAESIFMESSSESNEDERENTQEIIYHKPIIQLSLQCREDEMKVRYGIIAMFYESKKSNVEFCSQKWKASTANNRIDVNEVKRELGKNKPMDLICSIQDPRFKKDFLEKNDKKIGIKLLKDLLKEYKQKYPDTEKESSSNLKDKPLSMLDRMFKNKNCVSESRSSTELVQYLNAPRVDNIPGFDAILWWSKSSFHYL